MSERPSILAFRDEYRWLSNFWPVPSLGSTVEHHYQAAKTDDPEWAARILTVRTPGQAKRLGQQAPVRSTWDHDRIPVMRSLLVIKFHPNTILAAQLVNTGDAQLVEGNTWGDTFWGVCNGVGDNHLGELLMWVRSALWPVR